jgi:hypothetical protein
MQMNLPTFKSDPNVSKARVYYPQPSSVKTDLMPLYQQTAKDLDLKPAVVRAFAIVESDEKPVTVIGNPVTRFETGHWKKHRVASPAAMAFDKAKNSKNLDERWEQFEAMRNVNENAAILSHSFGVFQIMGFNYKLALCADPVTFLNRSMTIEGQFTLFKRFMLSSPALLSAARRMRADQVGFHYNGPQYKRNKYDVKWAAAVRAGGESVWA